MNLSEHTLQIEALLEGYRCGTFTPEAVIDEVLRRSAAKEYESIWIHLADREHLQPFLDHLATESPRNLPLFGIPFAIKDNIDVSGVPTTAGCPGYRYMPGQSAFPVQLLIDAGAIPIGKTNMDQFATGLTGTRSPFGVPPNRYNKKYIPGGSSSGSASAVAHHLVSFSLGTDTAGSGRVPAAFNGLLGWKPTRGIVSASGVVPACRSLDCVSVFAQSVPDVRRVMPVLIQADSRDEYSRPFSPSPASSPQGFQKVGVPAESTWRFFDNTEYEALYRKAIHRMEALGYECREIDFTPFQNAASLLYEGPWVAERTTALSPFLESHPEQILPVTRKIIERGKSFSATDVFTAQYRLKALEKAAAQIWQQVDFLLLPTAGTIYTIDEVMADPIQLNSHLGYYTNFMNLLDLSAFALPAGFACECLPFGITVCAPAFSDFHLLSVAEQWAAHPNHSFIDIAVCGAHMRGFPLNGQLVERGGRFVKNNWTAPEYRFFKLNSEPPKPGLLHTRTDGVAIEVEIWQLPEATIGRFLHQIPRPLGLGKIKLSDDTLVTGFLVESSAVEDATDISTLGSWKKA